ncbi:DUF4226 domain-containing protein [Nocardia jiangsuensis]|uniref:DUF4226 domain-containing protein n=1 Tax=Nocardia jiangsuensis TaxID=1691563 RepID=A0ABV8DSL2_9NOCA
MTTAGLRPPGEGAEVVQAEVAADETAAVTVTPWSPRGERRAAIPVRAGAPAEPPVTPVAASNPAPAKQFSALAGITAPSALLRQAAPAGTALPAPPTAAAPWVAPLAAPNTGVGSTADRTRAEDDDTDAPDTSAAANPATNLLPTLADALAKLGTGTGTAAPAAPTVGTTDEPLTTATGLSPQAERALRLLKSLAAAYGDGATEDPDVLALRKDIGRTQGTGSAAESVQARRLYQANFANAYNTLDNQLAGYITRAAGNTEVDRTAIHNLLREVNVAVNELGTRAYTREGQQQVHKILTAALVKANAIAGGTHAGNTDTAAFINQLTAQYLGNIAGRKTPDTTPVSGLPGGKVGDWIARAVQILRGMGYDPSKIDPAALAIIAKHESGNNPSAVNNWDSNAAKGIPSKGLMQTIGPTFDRWAVDGHRNILNPVDNIVAAARYAVNRYGSVSNVPGVVAVRAGRKYVGY